MHNEFVEAVSQNDCVSTDWNSGVNTGRIRFQWTQRICGSVYLNTCDCEHGLGFSGQKEFVDPSS